MTMFVELAESSEYIDKDYIDKLIFRLKDNIKSGLSNIVSRAIFEELAKSILKTKNKKTQIEYINNFINEFSIKDIFEIFAE